MVLGHPGLRLPRTAVGLLRQLNRLLYVRPGIELQSTAKSLVSTHSFNLIDRQEG